MREAQMLGDDGGQENKRITTFENWDVYFKEGILHWENLNSFLKIWV